ERSTENRKVTGSTPVGATTAQHDSNKGPRDFRGFFAFLCVYALAGVPAVGHPSFSRLAAL
ncbi:MAG: hypothetical protein ACOH1J_07565, partial [Microbacteriaceae bacterium]